MKSFFYYLSVALAILLGVIGLYLNIMIYQGPDFSSNKEVKQHTLKQLHYLEVQMRKDNLASRMQNNYPEGYVFSNAFYGLTWCKIAELESNTDSELFKKAIKEATWAFNQIDSDLGRRTFPENQSLKRGVFYCGWRNYLLGKIIATDPHATDLLKTKHKSYSAELASAFSNSLNPYLDSYPGDAWPVDNTVGMASILLNQPDSASINLAKNWIGKVKKLVVQPEGIVSSRWRRHSNNETEYIRGSSSLLNIRFLADVDPEFAREQFKLFRPIFEKTVLGMPAIREFPENYNGSENIDSGPVILDIGFAATFTSIGTYRAMGVEKDANMLFHSVHAFGMAREKQEDQLCYINGALPMADLFMAWGISTSLHTGVDKLSQATEFKLVEGQFGSRMATHLFSILIMIVLLLPWTIHRIRKRRRI